MLCRYLEEDFAVTLPSCVDPGSYLSSFSLSLLICHMGKRDGPLLTPAPGMDCEDGKDIFHRQFLLTSLACQCEDSNLRNEV